METLEDLILYFYVACGVAAFCFLLVFILIGLLFVKVNRLIKDKSNQLARQKEMMADFCYTNPTIVPGEELSRRGFSMYNGSNQFSADEFHVRGKEYVNYDEARSKF